MYHLQCRQSVRRCTWKFAAKRRRRKGFDSVLQAGTEGTAANSGFIYGQNGLSTAIRRPGEPGSQRSKRMAYPANYRYTNQHEWVDVKGDVATIGITDYAQHELAMSFSWNFPSRGTKVTAGKSFGTVRVGESGQRHLRACLRRSG